MSGRFNCEVCGAEWYDDGNYTVCPRLFRHKAIRARRERPEAERTAPSSYGVVRVEKDSTTGDLIAIVEKAKP